MARESQLKFDHPKKQSPSSSSLSLYGKLDPYQRDAVDLCLKKMTLALFPEQGTGKTWIALGVVEKLLRYSFVGLAVVPLTNKVSTWHKLLTQNLPQVNVCYSIEELKESEGPRLLLLHYEELRPIIKKLLRIKFTVIIFDESQRLKQRTSLQSRHASRLRNSAPYKLILSGTPMDERPIDLWAQFRFLRSEIFGTRWADFEEGYLEPIEGMPEGVKPGSFKWVKLMRSLNIRRRKRKFDYTKLPEFLKLIKPYCLRITQDEVLDLIPIKYLTVKVNMIGSQRLSYDEFERDLVLRIKNKTITAPMKAVLIGRLHQICGGYIKDEEGDTHRMGRAKLIRLRTLIEPDKFPIVIFCNYTAEAEGIAEALQDLGRVVKLTGKTKKKDRPIIQEEFQQGLIDILVCQIRTGGVGIDLYASNYAILYSFKHSFIDFDQAIKRLQRRGQTRGVTIILLLASDSIDIDIKDAVLKKCKVTDYVLSRLTTRSAI